MQKFEALNPIENGGKIKTTWSELPVCVTGNKDGKEMVTTNHVDTHVHTVDNIQWAKQDSE